MPLIILTCLLSFNALHYYSFSNLYGILPEKQHVLNDPVWKLSFYIHMGTGVVCLVIPIVLFLGRTFNLPSKWHKQLGIIYIIDVLVLVCPTGLYMAFYAKGGLWAQIGFVAQGVFMWYFTWMSYRDAKQRQFQQHRFWIIRSYAMAAGALTFRLYHIAFYYLEIPYEINYSTSQWISILSNLIIAEIIIYVAINKSIKINLSPSKLY